MDFTITIADADVAVLNNDLVDVQAWLDDAAKGRVNKSRKNLDREWRAKLDADPTVTSVPANLDARIALILARPDFVRRKDR